MAVWTDGLLLAACGPAVASYAPVPPAQELVAGPDPRPVRTLGGGRLLQVIAGGRCTIVRTEQPVRAVQPDEQGLLVQVEVDGWTLRHLGPDLYEVLRPTRWLRLPWDAPTPGVLAIAEYGLPAQFQPDNRTDGGGHQRFGWYQDPPAARDDDQDELDAGQEAGVPVRNEQVPEPGLPGRDQGRSRLVLLGLSWRLGWAQHQPGPSRNAIASAHRADGQEVGRWELGPGTVQAVTALRDRLVITVARHAAASAGSPFCAEVLALDPASEEPVTLLTGDSVDITEACWPLPKRPLDVDSYLAQVLAGNSTLGGYWQGQPGADGIVQAHPLAAGLSEVRTALVGDWPRTQLEWTFAFAPYPGLVLRRRLSLFDELGRPDPPTYADINLMEDLDTLNLPPARAAHDGVLDV